MEKKNPEIHMESQKLWIGKAIKKEGLLFQILDILQSIWGVPQSPLTNNIYIGIIYVLYIWYRHIGKRNQTKTQTWVHVASAT